MIIRSEASILKSHFLVVFVCSDETGTFSSNLTSLSLTGRYVKHSRGGEMLGCQGGTVEGVVLLAEGARIVLRVDIY